jgi:hypothetical protein
MAKEKGFCDFPIDQEKYKFKLCSFPECNVRYECKGLCQAHYKQSRRYTELWAIEAHINPCSFQTCGRPSISKGLCSGHNYQSKSGKKLVPLKGQRLDQQFSWLERAAFALNEVTIESKDSDCILYTGYIKQKGYGQISFDNTSYLVHRFAMAIKLGGLEFLTTEPVHHKCGIKNCVNFDHIEYVTDAENMAEMLARQAYIKRINDLEAKIIELEVENLTLRKFYG